MNFFNDVLVVELFDDDGVAFSSEEIGFVEVPVASMTLGEELDAFYPLQQGTGDLRLQLLLRRNGDPPEA